MVLLTSRFKRRYQVKFSFRFAHSIKKYLTVFSEQYEKDCSQQCSYLASFSKVIPSTALESNIIQNIHPLYTDSRWE